jgi:hypothetical protein
VKLSTLHLQNFISNSVPLVWICIGREAESQGNVVLRVWCTLVGLTVTNHRHDKSDCFHAFIYWVLHILLYPPVFLDRYSASGLA